MNEEQEKRSNVFLAEYKIVSDEIKERIGRSDKIIAVGLTVLSAGFVYGIKEKIEIIFLVLPIGLYGVIFYAIFNTTIVMTLGGHKKYIAERINTYFGEEILIWESVANKIIHRNIAQICLNFLYAAFLTAAVTVGYESASTYCYAKVYISVITVLSIALIISLSVMAKAFNKSYKISKSSWGQ
ncbi:MAG: hypothetical protein WC156_08420 [Pedobacter sp.]